MKELDVFEALSGKKTRVVKRAVAEGKFIHAGGPDSRLNQIYTGLAVDILEWDTEETERRPGKSLVVSSPSAGDGRTLTAVNLAAAASGLGAQVLLVDADFVNPDMPALLDVPVEAGLAEAVLDKRELGETALMVPGTNFRLLASGAIEGRNPFTIVTGKGFASVLNSMRQQYDLIVFDSAPICDNAYVMSLVRSSRDVLGVVRAEWTKRNMVARFMDAVRAADGVMAGTVFNDFRMVIPRPIQRLI